MRCLAGTSGQWSTTRLQIADQCYSQLLGICSSRLEPIHIKDCRVLKKIQRNATKTSSLKHVLNNLSYEERLTNLGLTTLEVRRERGDLIQLFKIEKEMDQITWVSPYTRGPPRS